MLRCRRSTAPPILLRFLVAYREARNPLLLPCTGSTSLCPFGPRRCSAIAKCRFVMCPMGLWQSVTSWRHLSLGWSYAAYCMASARFHSGESQASGECCRKAVLFILLATLDIAPARRHYKRDPHNIAVPGVAMLRKAPHANTKSIKKRTFFHFHGHQRSLALPPCAGPN